MFYQLSLPYTTSTKQTIYIRADREMGDQHRKVLRQSWSFGCGVGQNAPKVTSSRLWTCWPSQSLQAYRKNRPSATTIVEHTLSITAQTGVWWPKCWSKMLLDPLDGVATTRTSPISILALDSWDSLQKPPVPKNWLTGQSTTALLAFHRIGKGQLPAGLIATCRSPKITKFIAGGNDQLQRICRLGGIAKGKDGATATATTSICANVALLLELIKWLPPWSPVPRKLRRAAPMMAAADDADLLAILVWGKPSFAPVLE